MPVENARLFLEHLSSDSAFRAKFKATGATQVMNVVDFASAANYIFTEADLKRALQEFPDNPAIDQLRETLRIAKATPSARAG